MPLDPQVLDARIELRVCELRVVAASTFVQLSRHRSARLARRAAPWRHPVALDRTQFHSARGRAATGRA
jgi:hypothetical protein